MDYENLRKKFPAKRGGTAAKKKSDRAAIKAIAMEYARKKAELGAGAPDVKRGFPYYMAIIIALLLACGLAGSAIFGKGGIDLGGKKAKIAADSVRNLAIAAGRYKYHTGVYPTTEEGLAQLVSKKVKAPGWNGPYVAGRLKPDPWGNEYRYVCNGPGEIPTLYSAGPDGEIGSSDDIMAKKEDFEEPFRDTSWTEGWVRYELRGILPAVNERHKKELEEAVKKELDKGKDAPSPATAPSPAPAAGGATEARKD